MSNRPLWLQVARNMVDRHVLQRLARQPLASASMFLVTGVVLTGILSWQVLDNLRTRTATETARTYAASLEMVRDYYTQEIVPRAKEAGAEVRHDYRTVPGAIPMPATVSIELGQWIDPRMRFYSPWPYPYRADGGPRDDFEKRAIAALQDVDSKPIVQVNAGLTGGVLRYAEPVVMRAGCVGCHNNDPLSPRQDWVTGEVGGVQAVSVTLPALLPGFGPGVVKPDMATTLTMIGLLVGLLGVTGLLFLLLRRLNRSLHAAARRNQSLSVAREAAESANASKTRIMSNISHELRTPLNAIIGFSEMISQEALGTVGNPRYRDYAADIRDSGERLLGIIENMVSFAEIDSGHVSLTDTEIDLAGELERVRSMMAPLSSEHPHPISIVIPPVFPQLRMDRRALRNILANLLANAVQYSGKDAEIWVIASHHAEGVTIEVRDNGVGIAPGDLKRIMQPFERAGDPSFANVEGIGLGLSIAQEMAALHGAGITLESTPLKGTVASLNVPQARVVAARPDDASAGLARASTLA